MPRTLCATTFPPTLALCLAAPRADELRFAPSDARGGEHSAAAEVEWSFGLAWKPS